MEAAGYAALCVLLLADAWRFLDRVAGQPPAVPDLALDRAVVLLAALALSVLGGLAIRRGAGDRIAFAIGAACGVLFFARTLGLALADPGAIGWLMRGDWGQHYSGWAMFRQAPWSWPPGRLPELWYPVGTAIVYTDSLPLLALLLKPLSPWLPEPFQYIGLWLALNATLQGAFGALLVARIDRRPLAILAGAALFVFAPVFLQRIGHDTLTTQWLLLAALWLYFRTNERSSLLADAGPWWLGTAFASLVHPYLAAMWIAIQAAAWWKRARVDRARMVAQAAGAFLVSLAIAVFCAWLCGALTVRKSDASGGKDYGEFSFNLFGFLNPMGQSDFLPNLPYRPEQHEGFAYLGLGMLALGVAAALVAAIRRRPASTPARWRPLAVVAAATLAFAASSVLVAGSWVILDHPSDNPWLATFRASGRFVWISYYALMLAIVWSALLRFGRTAGVAALVVALVVQMADSSSAHERAAGLRKIAPTPPDALADPRWETRAAGRTHLTMLPPVACGRQAGHYLPFQLFAARHGMTFNSGYLARWNLRATRGYCDALGRQLAAGSWSPDELYVVGPDWLRRVEAESPPLSCEEIDGYHVCVVPRSPE